MNELLKNLTKDRLNECISVLKEMIVISTHAWEFDNLTSAIYLVEDVLKSIEDLEERGK